ncbi:MAG: hypothetical protein ABFR97_05980 [Thermodesulfobacteriota bacterium]
MTVRLSFGSFLLLALLLTGCSSTSLVNSWHDDQYAGPALQRVMVIGVLEKDINRRFFETQFVDKIKEEGRDGVASFRFLEDLTAIADRQQLDAAVQAAQVDSLLIVSVQGVEVKEEYRPGYISWEPSISAGYWDYYHHAYTARYVPGRTLVNRTVQLESRVYAVGNGEDLVWAGNTESFNPSTAQRAVDELADLIISEMKKADLID